MRCAQSSWFKSIPAFLLHWRINALSVSALPRGVAKKLIVPIDRTAAKTIAQRARGTPRIANRLLRRVRDFAQVKTSNGEITSDITSESMQTLGIDQNGLDDIDRKLLNVLHSHYNGGPVGIETLAATLNEEVDTLVDVIEPYLLKIGFLKRTSRGRELTDISTKHIMSSSCPDIPQKL